MEINKIKIFDTVKTNFALIGFINGKDPYNTEQCLRALEGFLAVVMQYLYLFFDAVTIKEYIDSIFMSTVAILIYMAYLSTVLKTEIIFKFIDEMENLVNERLKYPRSKLMYQKTNRLAEKISKFTQIGFVYISLPGFILPKAIYSYFIYFTTETGVDAFDLPMPSWFPFDWKNPIGYLIAVLLEFHLMLIPLHFIAPLTSFGITTSLFSLSLADDIVGDINAINESARLKRSHEFILNQCFGAIDLMTRKRFLVHYITDLYQITFTLIFLGGTGAICLAMLMIQISFVQGLNSVVLFQSICCVFGVLSLVLIVCEACQRVDNVFSEVDYVLGQLDWYLLPIEIQRALPAMIMFGQEPTLIKFFGSLSCSREQFKKVINAAYKYFMVLRKFY